MRGSDVRSSGYSFRQGSAGSLQPSPVDRLSAGFSKLQSPSASVAGPMSKNGVGVPYGVASSALAQRYGRPWVGWRRGFSEVLLTLCMTGR